MTSTEPCRRETEAGIVPELFWAVQWGQRA